MAEIYFTIAGTNYHHGQDFLEPKMKVKLVKKPDNAIGVGHHKHDRKEGYLCQKRQ